MGTRPTQQDNNTTINESISKCLVLLFLKRINNADIANFEYMEKILGISRGHIRQVKACPTSDPQTMAVFLEMLDKHVANRTYNSWKNSKHDANVQLIMATDFLCRAAAKKFHKPTYDNPASAFHALYRPDIVSSLMFQTQETVSVQVQPHTAPVQQLAGNTFAYPTIHRINARQPPPAPISDVFTSGPSTSFPMSAPPQSYMPPHSSYSIPMSQGYDCFSPAPLTDPNMGYQMQMSQSYANQQYQQPQYFNFPPNTPDNNYPNMYPPNPPSSGFY